MKKTLQSISFLLIGMLLISACTEEKTGKSPEKIADKIDIEADEIVEDTVLIDSVDIEEPIAPPPPPPPIDPWPPEPDPEPWPPEPWPDPPVPVPEPEPISPNPIVDFPDVEAEFKGGAEELQKFIVDNIKYPEVDVDAGNQGRVFVQFIVGKDGSLSDVKIMRGVSPTIDKEAKRIINIMPNWKPAESRGKKVRSIMRLPITFRMS